jgi:pyruvate/2-oxoglutarate dehydrogenase complex dihydrolipoamide acyltransferase (E2) component
MVTEVRIPSLGVGMTEGTIAEWLVGSGQQVAEGQPLYELENEKSVQEVESPASGVVTILVAADAAYEVGTLIATIE